MTVRFVITALVALVFFIPVYWMVISSLKDSSTMFHYPPALWPAAPKWSNYPEMLNYIPFMTYFWNTLTVSLISVAGMVISCPSVAYAFSKLHWKGRDACFVVVLSTMMLPFQAQMVPLYNLFRSMKWLGTLLPLIVPNFFGNALYIFLLRQFMIGI
ncbi:MAG: carbohydrate ABC transporter permease, partial [Eubacteriales bacterium]|nr:carbohydrate ABC transporter permease [Eubacteriales bacterium]